MITKGSCSVLRYELANGVALCNKCHYKFHNKDSQEAWEYMRLHRSADYAFVKAHKNDPNKVTVEYYREVVQRLEAIFGALAEAGE